MGRAAAGWQGPTHVHERRPLTGRIINPLERDRIKQMMNVGIGAINGLLTVGRGQRIGLFAGSGVRQERAVGHDDPFHQRRRGGGGPHR